MARPFPESKLVADEVHQVGSVRLIEHREGRRQPEGVAAGGAADWPRRENVPPQTRVARVSPTMAPARLGISRAARRLNVSRRMRSGATPLSMRWATREARVLVLSPRRP